MVKTPILYNCLYKKLLEKSNCLRGVIGKKEIKKVLAYGNLRIPKELWSDVIKELEEYGYIKRLNQRKYIKK